MSVCFLLNNNVGVKFQMNLNLKKMLMSIQSKFHELYSYTVNFPILKLHKSIYFIRNLLPTDKL